MNNNSNTNILLNKQDFISLTKTVKELKQAKMNLKVYYKKNFITKKQYKTSELELHNKIRTI